MLLILNSSSTVLCWILLPHHKPNCLFQSWEQIQCHFKRSLIVTFYKYYYFSKLSPIVLEPTSFIYVEVYICLTNRFTIISFWCYVWIHVMWSLVQGVQVRLILSRVFCCHPVTIVSCWVAERDNHDNWCHECQNKIWFQHLQIFSCTIV